MVAVIRLIGNSDNQSSIVFILHRKTHSTSRSHEINNSPLSFNTEEEGRLPKFFQYCACIRWRGNVFTDPLSSNDRGDKHTATASTVISYGYFFIFK
jgi:hypothetical protein